MTTNPHIVLVTGGAQGIGKCIARTFLVSGSQVIIADADEEAGRETELEYAALGKIRFVPADVADEGSVQALWGAVTSEYGHLEALVNNAGIFVSGHLPISESSLEEWNSVIGVNLTGAFLCSKYAAPLLTTSGGAIINIASTRALMSEAGTFAYSASKGGLVALTHSLAVSLGPKVRVNCISPGWIEVSAWKKKSLRQELKLSATDHSQHPAGRVGKPEDVAALVQFLAAPENGFITGANFVVDGGMTRKMIYVE
jgi:NAD(P)-dependent dehydrogenase (short-subunit alcohol dehydrogenase family)